MPAAKPPFMRFQDSYRVDETGCWIWTASCAANGYGQIKVFGEMQSAHRFAYSLHNGPIGHGEHILHSCDNKKCVNPDHLRAGSHAENMAEAAQRELMPKGRKHPMFGRKNPRPSQANRVRVLGAEYPSQKAAERALGLGSGTVRYWIKNRPEKAQIISKGKLCQA